jgi:hypothetical protein
MRFYSRRLRCLNQFYCHQLHDLYVRTIVLYKPASQPISAHQIHMRVSSLPYLGRHSIFQSLALATLLASDLAQILLFCCCMTSDKTCCYDHHSSTEADLDLLMVQHDIAPLGGPLVELATFLLSYFTMSQIIMSAIKEQCRVAEDRRGNGSKWICY